MANLAYDDTDDDDNNGDDYNGLFIVLVEAPFCA